jgi:hypothetical protein
MMKGFSKWVIGVGIVLAPAVALAQGGQITPPLQAELDRAKAAVAQWAADPAIVDAVKAQNAKGPMAGMDNAKWKTVRRSDPIVTEFQTSAAGQLLRKKCEGSGGEFTEAFLNGSRGEKVAFFEKTTSYIHAGSAKFDVPYTSGKAWQGKAEFDESSQMYAVQVSVPVLAEGKPIGALVVGVNLSYLEKLAKK